LYKCAYRAVRKLNAKNNYSIPLEVGGFAMSGCISRWSMWQEFLELLAADNSPEKKVDFFSMHDYSPNMYRIMDFYIRHKNMVKKLNLPNVPLFINEYGTTHATEVLTENLQNASGIISGMIMGSHLENAFTFPWCTFHDPERQISLTQFVRLEGNKYAPTPNGNAITALHMMLENEVEIIEHTEYKAVATSGDGKIALLVTNPGETEIELEAELTGMSGYTVKMTQYLVDDTHNNRITGEPVTEFKPTKISRVPVRKGEENDIPDRNAPGVLYFDAGWHDAENGFLEIGSSINTVYIAPGAVLNARVNVKGSGTLVCGRGIILEPFGDISRYDITVGKTEGSGAKLLTLSAANITVRDIKLLDARNYHIVINKENATITNVKLLSTIMTSDGITFGSAANYAKVKNCFIHNGDNIFIFSGFTSTGGCTGVEISDCIVGTTCGAIFPQGTLGVNTIKNLEVFRASEGLINNIYNTSTQSRTIEGLIIENLNAVDCEYFPWIFKGNNMGDGKKIFTLKNVSVPKSSGVDNVRSAPTNEDIKILGGGGYIFNIENLYVDGKPVENKDMLKISDSGSMNNVFNFSLNEETDGNIIKSPVSYEVEYKEPLKVLIGSSRQFLRTKPVMKKGAVVYLPLEEIAGIFKYNVETEGKTITLSKGNKTISATAGSKKAKINGKDASLKDELIFENSNIMAPLSFFEEYMGIPAEWDRANGYIRIANINDGENILNPNNIIIDKWVERICYNVDLLTVKEENEKAYYVCNLKHKDAGMERDVTDEVGRYGKGTYRLQFKAKTAQGKGESSLEGIFDYQYGMTKKNSRKSCVIKEEWQEYSLDFNITWEGDFIISARIGFCSPEMTDFLVKDIVLLKID